MQEATYKTLELELLIGLLARHVQTPLGRKRALQLSPSTNLEEINRGLDRTTECARYFESGGTFGLSGLSDPEDCLLQLQIEGASLGATQILALQSLTVAGMDLRGQFSGPEERSAYRQLSALTSRLADLGRLLASIRGKILPTGEIDDNASPELLRIRREINRARARIYDTLESLMRSQATAIQEELVTVRNGRFVVPVRTDSRGQVRGVMHGLSSSGQTSFVEPLSVIDQNNDLVRMRDQEELEIARILSSITEAFRTSLPAIREIVTAIEEVDFAQAKARLSAEFKCVTPKMTSGRRLLLDQARHPILEHTIRASGGRVVPISLEMDEAHQVMVISGPNAGGKTVVLKTVGLMSLMAQMGLHVPAAAAVLPVYQQVFAEIGDHQSIAANLSTFTAHMQNVSEIAGLVSPPALVLIDEVGTGTDPDEGAALAVAIVDHFHRAGATTIATTHYNPLKMWASQAEGVLNASVEFDDRTLRPTYRLITGVAGASSGLEIAERMNVQGEIIASARARLDPAHSSASDYLKRLKRLVDEQETLRAALEDERQATAEKFARLELEFAQREASRRTEFESELARVIQEFTAESQRLIGELKDRAATARLKKDAEARQAELRRAAGVRIRKREPGATGAVGPTRLARSESAPRQDAASSDRATVAGGSETREIRERDRVLINTLGQEGIVESKDGETYTVLAGSLRFRAKLNELELVAPAPAGPSAKTANLPAGVSATLKVDQHFSPELNIIGRTVDEATDRVDKFLDEAYLAGAENIRIVHGHGKGALRKAVAELLAGHPHVENFHPAPPNQGGTGATVVELRK